MSASEKLKALEAQGHRLYLNGVDVDIAPQIVAVAVAAEPIAAGPWPEGRAQELRAALAALDEALGGEIPDNMRGIMQDGC